MCFLIVAAQVEAQTVLPAGVDVDIQSTRSEFAPLEAIYLEIGYTNTNEHPVSFLTWGTALEGSLDGDLLLIHTEGIQIEYQGPIVRRMPPSQDDYINLQPGQRYSVVVSIESAYNIEFAGIYEVEYRPNLVSDSGDVGYTQFSLTADLPLFRRAPRFDACTGSQQLQLDAALARSETLSNKAKNDLFNAPFALRPTAQRYIEWFGAYDAGRYATVQSNFNKIASAASNQVMDFHCVTCRQGVIAYVYPSEEYHIYMCSLFFNLSQVEKTTTVVHELSHFRDVADTDDVRYSLQGSKFLARNSPASAVINADNYAYFAQNSPALPMPSGGNPPGSGGNPPGSGGGGTDPIDPETGLPLPPIPEPEPEPPIIAPILELLLGKMPLVDPKVCNRAYIGLECLSESKKMFN